MEPIVAAVVGSAGLLASAALHEGRKRKDRNAARAHALTSVLLDDAVAEDSLISVVAVSLSAAQLCPSFAGKRLQMRVKYGQQGFSYVCNTHQVDLPPACAGEVIGPLDATCLFSVCTKLTPLLRFRLLEAGCIAAKTAVSTLSACKHGLPLWQSSRCVGNLNFSVTVHTVEKGKLRSCLARVAAELQGAAVLVTGVPIALGGVVPSADWVGNDGENASVNESREEEAGEMLLGRPVRAASSSDSRLAHGPRRFRLQGLCRVPRQ